MRCYSTHHSRFPFAHLVLCISFVFKSRLCKSEVNIYVTKNAFVTNSWAWNLKHATGHYWSQPLEQKEHMNYSQRSHWTSEDPSLCRHPLQILVQRASSDCKGVLLLARKVCPPKKCKHLESSLGSTWAWWIFSQQKTWQVFTLYYEGLPTQFSPRLKTWITWNWGQKKKKEKNHKLKKKKNERQWAARLTFFMYWYWDSRLIQFSPILIHLHLKNKPKP